MPLLTVGYPMEKYDTDANLAEVRSVLNETIDQLRYILCNLDSGNVIEAASVKAQNIDVGQAKILDAQIGSLTADKIYTGTLDSGKVTISDSTSSKKIEITGSYISFTDGGIDRAAMGYLKDGTFVFYIKDPTGQYVQIGLDSNGTAYVRGIIDSSTIYASQIIGATRTNAADVTIDKVFAVVDPAGIGILQDKNGQRLQKIGMTVDSQGNAILVLGAGNGENSVTINDVTYSDDSFIIEKGDGVATLAIRGADSGIAFFNNGISSYVTVDGVNIKNLAQRVKTLEDNMG